MSHQDQTDIIKEGPVSTVSRTLAAVGTKEPQWLAVKSATFVRKFSQEPHDIKKELRILSSISHPNIIDVLNHNEETKWSTLHFWMPYIPISLQDILASPRFSPHPFGKLLLDEAAEKLLQNRFTTLSQSIMYQVLSGLVFLHAERIAHRDIKPSNILLTLEGCIKLIDFGIVWKDEEREEGKEGDSDVKRGDLWPEYRERMYFEVSTGPYRAPELLFGPRSYDPFAIDLWSLGATFAEFFTPLRLCPDDEDDEDFEHETGANHNHKPPEPFIMPSNPLSITSSRWYRDTLFDGSRGELGLACSIFNIRGTPTPETWPDFDKLPDAGGVTFTIFPTVPLAPLLPHLPASTRKEEVGASGVGAVIRPTPLDLLSRLLVYPPEKRLKAVDALSHPWFDDGILLPEGASTGTGTHPTMLEWERKTLGQWIQFVLTGAEDGKV